MVSIVLNASLSHSLHFYLMSSEKFAHNTQSHLINLEIPSDVMEALNNDPEAIFEYMMIDAKVKKRPQCG